MVLRTGFGFDWADKVPRTQEWPFSPIEEASTGLTPGVACRISKVSINNPAVIVDALDIARAADGVVLLIDLKARSIVMAGFRNLLTDRQHPCIRVMTMCARFELERRDYCQQEQREERFQYHLSSHPLNEIKIQRRVQFLKTSGR